MAGSEDLDSVRDVDLFESENIPDFEPYFELGQKRKCDLMDDATSKRKPSSSFGKGLFATDPYAGRPTYLSPKVSKWHKFENTPSEAFQKPIYKMLRDIEVPFGFINLASSW